MLIMQKQSLKGALKKELNYQSTTSKNNLDGLCCSNKNTPPRILEVFKVRVATMPLPCE